MSKQPKQPEILIVGNDLLADLALSRDILAAAQAALQAEVLAAQAKFEKFITEAKDDFEAKEHALLGFMEEHRDELFDGTDQVDLAEGILLHGEKDRVKIPRTALAELLRLKWEDGIKRADPVVDREKVEKWPVERLTAIGASKKPVEVYSYELKEEPNR